MAQAEAGKRNGMFDKLFGRNPELSPEAEWTRAFDTRMKQDPQDVLRFDKWGTHITLQQYGGFRMAHFDNGNSHVGRITVALGEDGIAHIVQCVPDSIKNPTSHTWQVLMATPSETKTHLKRNASDISSAKPHSTKDEWKGQRVENDRIVGAIQQANIK